MMHALELTREPGWVLTHEGYDVLSENAVESSFAYGNGLLGTRASRPVSRGPTWVSCWVISGGRMDVRIAATTGRLAEGATLELLI